METVTLGPGSRHGRVPDRLGTQREVLPPAFRPQLPNTGETLEFRRLPGRSLRHQVPERLFDNRRKVRQVWSQRSKVSDHLMSGTATVASSHLSNPQPRANKLRETLQTATLGEGGVCALREL